jgi:hypothetical protein
MARGLDSMAATGMFKAAVQRRRRWSRGIGTLITEKRLMEIAGMAHVQLTVNDLQRAIPFYQKVLGFLGMRPAVKAANGLYMIGGRTAVVITGSSEDNRDVALDQRRT